MASQEEKVLRFVTWNTNGIKSKWTKVLESLNDIETDIAFIQETHIGPNDSSILERVNGWKVFFTVHSSRSKGVAILIRDTVPSEHIYCAEDDTGGYIVLFCRLYGELYTLVNVYNHKTDKKVLGRLKDYLMDTARGVLVVGGDFNTVLHPSFDRKSKCDKVNHSPFRPLLEDFFASFYLRDTWAYLHPTDEGFTRSQNESHARLDMFFLPENTVGRARGSRTESIHISDHVPLVLDFRVKQQKVAAMLEESQCTPDEISGKITEAEILRAIDLLTYSEEQGTGLLNVAFYKINDRPITKILKIMYNHILITKEVPNDLKISKLEYLIFKRILASRLNDFLTPSFKGRMDANPHTLFTVKFIKGSRKIIWPFLENILSTLDQPDHNAPRDFSILDQVLPKGRSSYSDLRRLENGCPLTNPILNLALKYLDSNLRRELRCITSVCYQRQVLHIHTHPSTHEVRMIVDTFREDSGIKLKMAVTK